MLLKRFYVKDGNNDIAKDHKGRLIIDHIKVLRASKVQKFSPKIIQRGVEEGWLGLQKDEIELYTKPALAYKIETTPGWFCCFCKAKLADGPSAKEHVVLNHKGINSPDKEYPAGYKEQKYYLATMKGQ